MLPPTQSSSMRIDRPRWLAAYPLRSNRVRRTIGVRATQFVSYRMVFPRLTLSLPKTPSGL